MMKTYLCKEGRETFTVEAVDLKDAKDNGGNTTP